MIKKSMLLVLVALLLIAVPASAKENVRVGDKINVFVGPYEYQADQPFHVSQGWIALPDGIPVGLVDFMLDVDDEYFDVDFTEIGATTPLWGQRPYPFKNWIVNFPEGMDAGQRTITAHWFGPCQKAVDAGEYPGRCPIKNEQVEISTHSLEINFTSEAP
ncbi:MAG: hypothetical protein ACC700_19230 [Anaerolineales bacterium]